MKINYKKILKYILIFILIILFIKIFFFKGIFNNQKIDDILFLKLLSNGNSSEREDSIFISTSNIKEYRFKIDYKNIDFKSIDLSETIDRETLVYEKIAPGTSGSFNILLDSNQNLRYKVIFDSLNEKPKNLNFIALKDDVFVARANTLEELSEQLSGSIDKNQKINITINWYWEYENDEEQTDIQDTNDAENIRRYQFNISTLGEEI